MDKDTIIKFSPIIVVVISVIFQWNLFVTPEKHEIMRREILAEVGEKFVTKDEYRIQQDYFKDMKMKLDKIYDFIFLGKK